MTRMTRPDCAVMRNLINTHTHTREDQCEWHRMTRMTGPDCVVMCNLINTHTHTHTHTHTVVLDIDKPKKSSSFIIIDEIKSIRTVFSRRVPRRATRLSLTKY